MAVSLLSNPSIEDIKNIPKDVIALYIQNELSLECMKEINKLDRISCLNICYTTIGTDVSIEISKSKTIKSFGCVYINDDCMNEILKSTTIIEVWTASPLIQKSIVLKKKNRDFIFTTLNLYIYGKISLTSISTKNVYNWKQKYGIL